MVTDGMVIGDRRYGDDSLMTDGMATYSIVTYPLAYSVTFESTCSVCCLGQCCTGVYFAV